MMFCDKKEKNLIRFLWLKMINFSNHCNQYKNIEMYEVENESLTYFIPTPIPQRTTSEILWL